jgi:dCTP deaminase
MNDQLRAHAFVDAHKTAPSQSEGITMILNDREISLLAHEGMITPYAEGVPRPGVISYGVTSFGYDMRVAGEWVRYAPYSHVDPLQIEHAVMHRETQDYTRIGPGQFVLCRSVETFAIPEDVVGIVVGKSTYARCGLIVNCTPMEPGWRGELTIELHNCSSHHITVHANQGIAQVMFFRGERPAITYADKRGKYQGQSGVTLPRVTQ